MGLTTRLTRSKVKRDPPTLTSSDDAQKVKHEFSSSGKVIVVVYGFTDKANALQG